MKAADWDERYRAKEFIWGVEPNRWVAQELAGLPPGRALDLACGEGRNAIWLATHGWQVTAIDFSEIGLDKARTLAEHAGVTTIDWRCADVTTYRHDGEVDLALISYLHLPADERRVVVRNAAAALAIGGSLLMIGHESANLTQGAGGPQDPAVLFTAADIAGDLAGTGLLIDRADAVLRPYEGAPRPAIDALVRAHRRD